MRRNNKNCKKYLNRSIDSNDGHRLISHSKIIFLSLLTIGKFNVAFETFGEFLLPNWFRTERKWMNRVNKSPTTKVWWEEYAIVKIKDLKFPSSQKKFKKQQPRDWKWKFHSTTSIDVWRENLNHFTVFIFFCHLVDDDWDFFVAFLIYVGIVYSLTLISCVEKVPFLLVVSIWYSIKTVADCLI